MVAALVLTIPFNLSIESRWIWIIIRPQQNTIIFMDDLKAFKVNHTSIKWLFKKEEKYLKF